MEVAVGEVQAGIIGRAPELAALGGFLGADVRGRSLVLAGGAGIGKTTLWQAGVDLAPRRGLRVLEARASGAEARLSFTGLIDLFEGVDAGTMASLPAPQRSALEVALLRAEPTGVPPEPQAIAFGVLNGLRALSAAAPVLVAIDDVQWLDAPSGDALVFAARRLGDERVAFLLARRPGAATALEQALAGRGLERLEVGPMSLGATRRMLSERLGLSVSRPLLRRIVEATLANPLFALEVGRSLVEGGLPGVGEGIPVPDAVEDMLGTRVAGLAAPVRRLLLALALSGDLHISELAALADAGTLEDAVDDRLVVVDGDRVRASHPLLAAAAAKHARARERRELHRGLASAVADEQLRALHLALASERPDARLAATVAEAAGRASARGARQEEVVLGEHALRLTPADAPERSERLLALAGYLEAAGEQQRLTDLLAPEIDSLPAGPARARGLLLLAEGAHVTTVGDYERHLDMALAECASDPGLHARALATKATNSTAAAVSRIAEAEAWAREALPDARREGPEAERRVLYALGWASAMRGRPIDDLCERFRRASPAAFYIVHSPVRVAGQRLVWRGQLDAARADLSRLLALADERGEPASYALARLHLCELELRAGEWDAAARLLDEWAESSERELLPFPMYERCRALLAVGRGLPGEAERWADRAIAAAERIEVRWDWLEALRARGVAALLAREPRSASESLRAVWSYTEREGVGDPGAFPVAPELVEALAELAELDEARAVSERLAELAEPQEHPWGRASVKRCRAVMGLASAPYDEPAAAALAAAAGDYDRLGLRFDSARCLLALGRAQRRFKQWAAARESLAGAVAAFDALGSVGWAQRARSELARVGGRRPRAGGELTPTEREIVELAARGLANKEIAQALYVAVHTVEVHLSRAYAKLGVRSRTQLAARVNP